MWGEKNQVCVDVIPSAATLKLFTQECRCRNWTVISGSVLSVLETGELKLDHV